MKKRISFKTFFTVLWRGIWQCVEFILKPFGYKREGKFAKNLQKITLTCIAALIVYISGVWLYFFTTEFIYDDLIRPHTKDAYVRNSDYISNHIVHQDLYRTTGRIYDKLNDKILLKGVDWVAVSDDKDSLAVFSKDDKRGYINRFTGEIAIPLSFTRAWVFSEGLAAVEKDGELVFIDHTGRIVIDKDLQVHFEDPAYAFKNGYCVVQDDVTGKDGLIDKEGNWVLPAEYDEIYNSFGFWKVEKDGLVGLYDSTMKEMFPLNNISLWVFDDYIEVRTNDYVTKHYDYDGNVVVDFVIDNVENMEYETTELGHDSEGCSYKIYAVADKQRYCIYHGPDYEERYGLIDRNGRRITGPLYTLIEAIGKDLYLCQPGGIIINGQGKEVTQ